MRRALAAAALIGGLIGYGAGAVIPAVATDQFQELTLYRSGYALIVCANFGDGELGFERIDHQSAVLTCTGPQHDKDGDNVDDRDERRGRN